MDSGIMAKPRMTERMRRAAEALDMEARRSRSGFCIWGGRAMMLSRDGGRVVLLVVFMAAMSAKVKLGAGK